MAYLEYLLLCRPTAGVVGHIGDGAISLHSQSFQRYRHSFTRQHSSVQDISVLCGEKDKINSSNKLVDVFLVF